jgi:hypothetical protein
MTSSAIPDEIYRSTLEELEHQIANNESLVSELHAIAKAERFYRTSLMIVTGAQFIVVVLFLASYFGSITKITITLPGELFGAVLPFLLFGLWVSGQRLFEVWERSAEVSALIVSQRDALIEARGVLGRSHIEISHG